MIFPFSQSVVDIIATGKFMVLYAFELQFKDETIQGHTGTGQLIIDGQAYDGANGHVQVGSSSESGEASSPLATDLTLSGLDPDIIRETSINGCRGRPGKLMFVAVAEDGSYAVDTLLSGRMDAARFAYGREDNQVQVPVVDRMAEWDRTGTERWTDEQQRARHDGDRFFRAVAQLANSPIYWGAKKDAPSFTYD